MNKFSMFELFNSMLVGMKLGHICAPNFEFRKFDEIPKKKSKPIIVVDSNGNVVYENFIPMYSTKPLVIK